MNTIQEMKDRREKLTLEMESIQRELAPLAEALDSPEVILQDRQSAVQDEIDDHNSRISSLKLQIHILNKKINRLEALTNRENLTAGYISAMATWKADELELNEKRNFIEIRLHSSHPAVELAKKALR